MYIYDFVYYVYICKVKFIDFSGLLLIKYAPGGGGVKPPIHCILHA